MYKSSYTVEERESKKKDQDTRETSNQRTRQIRDERYSVDVERMCERMMIKG